MSVKELHVVNFRNLASDKLSLHSDLNFLIGDNGSGKSSLLESLFYLGHGKSFRTNKVESLIQNEFDSFIIPRRIPFGLTFWPIPLQPLIFKLQLPLQVQF